MSMISMVPRGGVCALLKCCAEPEARQVQLIQMLTAQPFVGREQDDLVGKVIAAPRLEVVQVLADVDVQQQGLAAAGGIPEGDLVQVIRFKIAERLRAKFSAR
jgi:hypothetical protein